MDIDLFPTPKIDWKQDKCPWNEKDCKKHKCAIKSVSLCKHFRGIKEPDTILCNYK